MVIDQRVDRVGPAMEHKRVIALAAIQRHLGRGGPVDVEQVGPAAADQVGHIRDIARVHHMGEELGAGRYRGIVRRARARDGSALVSPTDQELAVLQDEAEVLRPAREVQRGGRPCDRVEARGCQPEICVAAASSVDGIIAGPTVDDVVPGPAGDGVVSWAANQASSRLVNVGRARVIRDHVVSGTALNDVVAITAIDDICSVATFQNVVPSVTE